MNALKKMRRGLNQFYARYTYGAVGVGYLGVGAACVSALVLGVGFTPAALVGIAISALMATKTLVEHHDLSKKITTKVNGDEVPFISEKGAQGKVMEMTKLQSSLLAKSSAVTKLLSEDFKKAKKPSKQNAIKNKIAREKRFRQDVLSSKNIKAI